jgi:hypothetical protein
MLSSRPISEARFSEPRLRFSLGTAGSQDRPTVVRNDKLVRRILTLVLPPLPDDSSVSVALPAKSANRWVPSVVNEPIAELVLVFAILEPEVIFRWGVSVPVIDRSIVRGASFQGEHAVQRRGHAVRVEDGGHGKLLCIAVPAEQSGAAPDVIGGLPRRPTLGRAATTPLAHGVGSRRVFPAVASAVIPMRPGTVSGWHVGTR